jgi:hypothetical protein
MLKPSCPRRQIGGDIPIEQAIAAVEPEMIESRIRRTSNTCAITKNRTA